MHESRVLLRVLPGVAQCIHGQTNGVTVLG